MSTEPLILPLTTGRGIAPTGFRMPPPLPKMCNYAILILIMNIRKEQQL